MKFSLLALSLFTAGASAFAPKASVESSTKLFSSRYEMGLSTDIAPGAPAGGLRAPPPGDGVDGIMNAIPLQEIWEQSSPVRVQGDSLKTWSLMTPSVELVQVMMKTEGRPLNANVELWQGPDNTPQKMSIYVEDGNLRPVSIVIPTPRDQNAIAVYNTGHIEFPLEASVEADAPETGSPDLVNVAKNIESTGAKKIIQGGAIQTFPYPPAVESVAIMLKTDGRPLNARMELMQGPNNNKQVMEIYTEDGMERPFFAVLETPGVGNVVRVINTGTMEFPLTAVLQPYVIGSGMGAYGNRGTADGHFFLDG